ncbi:MAG: formyltetrahydrofolate deformylase, partial [Acidimicrobiales bacterium]
MPEQPDELALKLSCADRVGIVNAVSGVLAAHGCNIAESRHFEDRESGRFFMRVHVETLRLGQPEDLEGSTAEVGAALEMDWELPDVAERPKVIVLVSKLGHCLNDLLYRHRIGALAVTIPAVVSNHDDFESLVRSYGVQFRHLPVSPATKPEQDAELVSLVEDLDVELVVLARYMQILSPSLCERLAGKAINIHHGLLPAFKGARPYHQAFERGVKVIGATAHYDTTDLDEGPI